VDEVARKTRNSQRLNELHQVFARRVSSIIAELEADGYRPRIQDAWRSPEAQLAAFKSGNSKLEFGFHNVTGVDGQKESLAVDLLDDDFPLNSRIGYLLRLAGAALKHECQTGVKWGLPLQMQQAIDDAISSRNWNASLKIGWDPTHIEPTDVTVSAAKDGKRPQEPVAAPTRARRTTRGKRHK
jgi:hypothetical protein